MILLKSKRHVKKKYMYRILWNLKNWIIIFIIRCYILMNKNNKKMIIGIYYIWNKKIVWIFVITLKHNLGKMY